eukprot:12288.XXX_509788_505627_1 [CDS] Oithona nana genome sequencing.
MTNIKKIASEAKCTIVVIGDSRTGKSVLLHRFVHKTFQPVYMPTSFDKSFGQQEVNKHLVHFSFWDTSGSPAYDSVRPLSYQEADVFLLCYKISDPISLYNVKNKWIRELRKHRPDVPVILCGCQADLRSDPATLNHLSKTGRTPVSSDQALAICCEIQAVNYVETSAKHPDNHNSEAFELCALAAIKHKNNASSSQNVISNPHFVRSPSLNSSLSLFEPLQPLLENNNFLKKQLRHSYRQHASAVAPPPLASPSSFSECDARLSTFSPEPLARPSNLPPSIAENEAYQSDTNVSVSSFQTFMQESRNASSRPTSLHVEAALESSSQLPKTRPQRPTTLFKTPIGPHSSGFYNPQTLITPTGDPQKRLVHQQPISQSHFSTNRRFDSYSDLNNSSNAMIRPNCLTRRTSYRTYQKVPIPVAAPMSPVGSDYSFDLKSPTSSSCFSPLPRLAEAVAEDTISSEKIFEKTYESLKSTCSSQNSSKASSTASAASSADLSTYKLRLMESSTRGQKKNEELDSSAESSDESNLIKNLNFVSPKSGVYRPLPEGSRRYKQSCNVM